MSHHIVCIASYLIGCLSIPPVVLIDSHRTLVLRRLWFGIGIRQLLRGSTGGFTTANKNHLIASLVVPKPLDLSGRVAFPG